jgi:RNA polymerase sigma-70 factor (TIGR02960 family)
VFARETIELAFIAVIQALPPRQRAVLILRDVLKWSAAETAGLLDISVAAANSALQRARATISGSELPATRSTDVLTADERALLQGFIETHESGDVAAAAKLIRDDIRVTMPPNPWLYEGRDAIMELMRSAVGPERPGDWLLVPTRANRMPAAASYLRARGDSLYRAFKLDVLRVQDGLIAEITTFDARLFGEFGLPATRTAR